jgi:hypothetical protein
MIHASPKSMTESGMRRTVAAAMLLLSCAAAAHEGHHDHDADEAPAPVAAAPSPALAADTPQLELVVKRQQNDLLLYLDDYASDAPLDGLQVEVHSGSRVLQAAAAGEGLYRLPADLLDGAAGATLQIVVHGHGLDASVPGELPPAPAQPHTASVPHGLSLPPWSWVTAAAVALLALLLFRFRLRRRALAA